MRLLTIFVLLIVVVVYLCLGAGIFMTLETDFHDNTKSISLQTINDFLGNNSCVPKEELTILFKTIVAAYHEGLIIDGNLTYNAPSIWNYHNSLFFSMTVISTIGYGNQTPSTTAGRVCVIFYALIGIPIFAVLLAGIGEKLSILVKTFQKRTCMTKFPRLERILKSIFICSVGLAIFTFIPAIVFSHVEGWTYTDSVYYAVVTLTTIGFGDFVIGLNSNEHQAAYKISIVLWIFVGLAWVALVLGQASEIYKEKTIQAEDKLSQRIRKGSKQRSNSENGKSNSIKNPTFEPDQTEESTTL